MTTRYQWSLAIARDVWFFVNRRSLLGSSQLLAHQALFGRFSSWPIRCAFLCLLPVPEYGPKRKKKARSDSKGPMVVVTHWSVPWKHPKLFFWRKPFAYPPAHCIPFQYPPWPKHTLRKQNYDPQSTDLHRLSISKVHKVRTLKSKHFSQQNTVPNTKV